MMAQPRTGAYRTGGFIYADDYKGGDIVDLSVLQRHDESHSASILCSVS